MNNVARLLINFAKKHGIKIISDGDLDGIFATALLLIAFKQNGFKIENIKDVVHFPHPRTLKGLKISESILIELPQSKGLIYAGNNLLLDHHPEPPRVEIYSNEKLIERYIVKDARSAASLVYKIFEDLVKLPESALKILNAVDEADNLQYTCEFSKLLHAAYHLHVTEEKMRFMLVEMAFSGKWDKIVDWAKKEGEKYMKLVPKKVRELVSRAEELAPSVVLFTYDSNDQIEKAAITEAMRLLEEKYDIVISLGVLHGKPESARIATMKDIDLIPMFNEIVKEYGKYGVTAGGRKNVGGAQFRQSSISTVEEAKRILKRIIQRVIRARGTD